MFKRACRKGEVKIMCIYGYQEQMEELEYFYNRYDHNDILTLLFDEGINRFVDTQGNIINNIYKILTPNQVMLFKKEKEYVLTPDVSNTRLVELIYFETSDI